MQDQIIHAGRRVRCGQCNALVSSESLANGKCGACAVQPTLPLRDNQGRFFSGQREVCMPGTRGGLVGSLVMVGGLL
ncbi:hypothetical protein GCM10022223_47090 [Kineosporia mesophila]|uniref:Uncharacterized protein n=1 Tax=Kineosporia mesophila TaxID=566012 RepID=A0ABP7A465_9ACTN|nr:hypothetical protein [Kineosporia mesophila]MCD5353817.1 hypothetical protein [Kineosporia mesophila]